MGSSGGTISHSRPRPPREPQYRKRRVPMKVLALGLPRTGTASLRQALVDLGYVHTYHFDSLIGIYRVECTKWIKALAAKFQGKGILFMERDWDDLLYTSQAVTDIPCIIFYNELLRAYPNARVILTVRESAEEWAASYRATVREHWHTLQHQKGVGSRIRKLMGIQTAFQRMCSMIDEYFLQQIDENPEKFYNDWVAEIKRKVSSNRLLIFNVKEGYKPMYQFSKAGEPPNQPFPHLNARLTFPAYFTAENHVNTETRPEQTISQAHEDAQPEAYDFRGVQSE